MYKEITAFFYKKIFCKGRCLQDATEKIQKHRNSFQDNYYNTVIYRKIFNILFIIKVLELYYGELRYNR